MAEATTAPSGTGTGTCRNRNRQGQGLIAGGQIVSESLKMKKEKTN